MRFNYQARDQKGQTQIGVVEASSKEAALQILARHGLFVTILEESAKKPFYARRIAWFERIGLKDIMLFSKQLSVLFRSQVSLLEALRTLSSQTKNPTFKEQILKISEEVEGGASLSQALSQYPATFSQYFISMVRSGELSGSLSQALETLAEHLEREYTLRSKIRSALTYPIFILAVGFIVLALLMFFIVPNIAQIFAGLQKDLPFITKLALSFANFFRRFWWIFVLIFFGFWLFISRYTKTSGGKKLIDRQLLNIPLLNQFLRMIYLARFAENLSTLVKGGLPIVQALEATQDVVGNTVYKEIIGKAKEAVRSGERISDILQQYPEEFPPLFTQMVLVGEKSGTLDTTLLEVNQFYQREVANAVDSFLSILEPVLIVFLGLFVGGLMAAVLLPLYRLAL